MTPTLKYSFAIGCVMVVALVAWPAAKKTLASSDEAEFRMLIERYYAEWSTADANKAAPLYAKDAELVFFDLAPLKYTGWEEYKVGVQKNFFDKMTGGKVTPNMNDLKVMRRGNIAWTTVTNHFSITLKNGRTFETDGRQTAIWQKRGGKWLIVHEHVSAPLPPL